MIVEQLREKHPRDTRLNVDWEDTIHHSLFCLERMPPHACPCIVVVTDGCGVLAQVLRWDMSVNTMQSCERQYSPNAPFGHVQTLTCSTSSTASLLNGVRNDHKTINQQLERQKGRDKDLLVGL